MPKIITVGGNVVTTTSGGTTYALSLAGTTSEDTVISFVGDTSSGIPFVSINTAPNKVYRAEGSFCLSGTAMTSQGAATTGVLHFRPSGFGASETVDFSFNGTAVVPIHFSYVRESMSSTDVVSALSFSYANFNSGSLVPITSASGTTNIGKTYISDRSTTATSTSFFGVYIDGGGTTDSLSFSVSGAITALINE